MPNSSEIDRWIGLCKVGVEERRLQNPLWDEIEAYFRGTQWGNYQQKKIETEEDSYQLVTVNYVYSHIKSVVPIVYPRNPRLYFEPNTATYVDIARLNEVIFNADMNKMRLKQTNQRIIQDVVLYGVGYSKTTYEVEDGSVEFEENQPIYDNIIERFKNTQVQTHEDLRIEKSGPRIVRVPVRDLVTALGVTDFYDPGFIGHHVRKRLMSIKNDKFYKNTSSLQPTYKIEDTIFKNIPYASGVSGDDEMLQMVDLWEIWDVENQKWFVIAEGHDKYLVEPRDNILPYDHPFDALVFTSVENTYIGMGEIEPWLPQADEVNLLRTQAANHVKRYNRKYIIDSNALEDGEEGIQRLEAGKDGTVLISRGTKPINDIVASIQDAPMPADVFRYSLQVEDDIVKIGKVTPYRRGGTVGANTATEANLAEGSAQISDMERRDKTADFVKRQMEKVRLARKEFTVGQETLDVTGNPIDTNRWVTWTKKDIDIESQMRVEFSDDLPLDQQSRVTRAIQLYDRAVQNPTVNPQSAFSQLLEAFEINDQTQWFLPSEIIKLQMLMKVLGAQESTKGQSPLANPSGLAGQTNTPETPAELSGRAAPNNPNMQIAGAA